MKVAAWKKHVQVGVLAVSLMALPLVAPTGAQTAGHATDRHAEHGRAG